MANTGVMEQETEVDAKLSSTTPSTYSCVPEAVFSGKLRVTGKLVKYGFRLTFLIVTTTTQVSYSPPESVTCTVMLNVEVTVTSMSVANEITPVVALMTKFGPSVIA